MAVNVRVDGLFLAVSVGLVAAAALAWTAYRNRERIGDALDTVNPASDENIVYQSVNGVLVRIGAVDEGNTLGTQIYEFIHGEG